MNERPDTIEKALSVNLNPLKYGTVAEIGADARHLLVGLKDGPVFDPPHTIEFGSQTEKTIWQ